MELLGVIVSDYKSVSMCEVPLSGLTVLVGPNGVGKSNLLEAIGGYDPQANALLAREGGSPSRRSARVGFVTRLNTSVHGGGDRDALRNMIIWPWAEGIPSAEITDGVGAFCGSVWWIDGADLYDPATHLNLSACLDVIRGALLAPLPAEALAEAERLLELLLQDPVLIVQEDFAVELSVDRDTEVGRQAFTLGRSLRPRLPDCGLAHLIGVLTSWTGRWPPLTVLTRGPSGTGNTTPAGFGWIAEEVGGVEVVSGDVLTLEQHLDQALPLVHDRQLHSPDAWGPGEETDHAACDQCLDPSHAGRVDPAIYVDPDNPNDPPEKHYPGSTNWLETREDWVRIRPALRTALVMIEDEANARLVNFVAAAGQILLNLRPPTEWNDDTPRCAVRFRLKQADDDPVIASWHGPVGVAGYSTQPHFGEPLTVDLADLGAGMRRWVAAAIRLATADLSSVESSMGQPSRVTVPRKVVLIDEPEQHLHPQAQLDVAQWCLRESRTRHSLLVATHSQAFLSLPPEAVAVCQVSRVGRQTLVQPLPSVHGVDVVRRAQELGFQLGLGSDALAQLTRAVLVVEGEWDRQVLLQFFSAELAEQRVLVVPLQGSEEVGGMADAAVIPALGMPAIALLDDVRATSKGDFDKLPPPLSKAERALRDLSDEMGSSLRFVRYEDPDVICALPETAVRRAFPHVEFKGWPALLSEWEKSEPRIPFKRFAINQFGLPKRSRTPAAFFRTVLDHTDATDLPGQRFVAAVKQALAMLDEPTGSAP